MRALIGPEKETRESDSCNTSSEDENGPLIVGERMKRWAVDKRQERSKKTAAKREGELHVYDRVSGSAAKSKERGSQQELTASVKTAGPQGGANGASARNRPGDEGTATDGQAGENRESEGNRTNSRLGGKVTEEGANFGAREVKWDWERLRLEMRARRGKSGK